MDKITKLTNRVGFSRKLAFTFFICSLLTFIVIDIIMNVLYSKVITTTNAASTFDTQAFSQFSNHEILSSTQAWMVSGLDLFEQILAQISTTYIYFKSNPSIYSSNLKKGKNPRLTSYFTKPSYDRSSVYFYSPNSTFYDEPFIDKVLASVSTKHYPSYLQRINVVYQSKDNIDDLTVHTIPATSDFYIPNSQIVQERIAKLKQSVISYSDLYYDQYSIANNSTRLIAMRLLMTSNSSDYNMMVEIEVQKVILDFALAFVLSFPYTQICILKTKNIQKKQYSILGCNSANLAFTNFSAFLSPGSFNVSLNSYEFLVTTKALLQNDKESPESDMVLVKFLNKSETSIPNQMLQKFLVKEESALVLILYGWTFIVLLVVSSIGVTIGDIIFSYFSLIRKKCKQYLKNPKELKEIDIQINKRIKIKNPFSVQLEARNQLLLQNTISIMHNVQNKKAENKKKYKITYDMYPLNPLGINFQRHMKINDYKELEQLNFCIMDRANKH